MNTTTALIEIIETIAHTPPTDLVFLDASITERVASLVDSATVANPKNADDLTKCNGIFRDIDALAKDIAAHRLALTRPVDALKTKLIELEKQATEPLATAKKELGMRMLAVQKELDRIAREARAKAEAEARAKAEAERQRLEAERQKIIEQQRAEHAAKQAAAEAEAAMFGGVHEPIAPPAPPVPVVIPVVEPPAAITEAAPKLAVRTTTRHVMEITDETALMAAACKEQGKLYGKPVLTVDSKAVEALLKAGVAVPGARLIEVTSVASAGRGGRS